MSDLISVIVPCYNYSRYLSDAIYSLVGGNTSLGGFKPQTLQSFEVIIVDDASEDDTAGVGQEFAANLPNVSYIRNPENLGTAGTLNVGVRRAKGTYITFLSADDMMETTRLEKLYNAALQNPHRIIYDDLVTFANGQRKMTMPMSHEYDFDKLLYKNTMHAGVFYSRVAWEECGGYPELFRDGREDWAFNVALGRFGWCGVHIREPLYLYRWENQNRSLRNAGVDWRLTFLNKMQQTFPDLYQGERPKMCCGNGKKKPAAQASIQRTSRSSRAVPQALTNDVIVGAEGMTILEYQLTKAGPVVYQGAVTKQTYIFGGKHKLGNIDNRDVPALIARIEDRRHAFAYPANVTMIAPTTEKPTEPTKEIVTEPMREEPLPEPMEYELTKEEAEILIEAMKESTALKPRRGRRPKAQSA